MENTALLDPPWKHQFLVVSASSSGCGLLIGKGLWSLSIYLLLYSFLDFAFDTDLLVCLIVEVKNVKLKLAMLCIL